MGSMISFPGGTSGKPVQGYLAEAPDPKAPGVVVIQEWWGLQGQVKSVCDRLSQVGFTALAPDLFGSKVVPYHDQPAAAEAMKALDFKAAVAENVRGAAQHLKSRGGKVGLTGFCMGGAIAVIGAVHIPDLSAAVSFYGIPPEAAADPAAVRVPLQGHFAMKDEFFTPQAVDAYEKKLAAAGKTFEFYRYQAHHAFANSERKEVHDPEATKLAWERTMRFLGKYLG